jgi:hypothetical protein
MGLALLLLAALAHADEATLAGMQVGRDTLAGVLSRFGNSPLRNGDVDELCYRSESPLEPYWVIFGSGPQGDYQTLTQIRVVFSAPPEVTCPPSALLTGETLSRAGIRAGQSVKLTR